jgi:SNF2 family DNA or RNA helicase
VNDLYAKAVIAGALSPDGRDIIISVEGGDHQAQEAAAALRHMTAMPRVVRSRYEGKAFLPCTWAVVTQLARTCERHGMAWKPGPELNLWITEEFTRRYTEDGPLLADLSGLERKPFPHQAAGAFVVGQNRRFFIADSAGVGKTQTALMSLAELEARGHDPFPALVVAPAGVVDPWLEELEACFPTWPVAAYLGPRRRNLSTRYKVYVTSWTTFAADMHTAILAKCECPREQWARWTKPMEKFSVLGQLPVCKLCHVLPEMYDTSADELPPLLNFIEPHTMVMDESHVLCATGTRQTIATHRLARVVPNVLLMSGTPITHDISGFWSAMTTMDVRSFPNEERFKENYAETSRTDYGGPTKVEGLSSVNRDEFFTVLQGTMRRVDKSDVLTDLPPKTYSTRVVQLPPAYRAAYDEMERDMIAHIPDTDEPLSVMNSLAQLTRLTQLASSACDVEIEYVLDERVDSPTFGEERPHYLVTMREPSWKIDALMELKDDMREEPVVVFAPSTQLLKLGEARAERAGYRVGHIWGGQSRSARTATRQTFQAGELDLLFCNVAAGGVGLTLHRSHIMVKLEQPFAFWRDSQSEDRLHRAGQTEQVHIIDVFAADTVESRVREVLREKAFSLSELVQDPRIFAEILGR